MFKNIRGKISQKILSGLKHGNQCAIGLEKTINDCIEAAEHFLFRGLTAAWCGGMLRILGFGFLGAQRIPYLKIIVK